MGRLGHLRGCRESGASTAVLNEAGMSALIVPFAASAEPEAGRRREVAAGSNVSRVSAGSFANAWNPPLSPCRDDDVLQNAAAGPVGA